MGHHEIHDYQAVEQGPLNEVAPAGGCRLAAAGWPGEGVTWQTVCLLISVAQAGNP